MKSIFTLAALLILFSFQSFCQDGNHRTVIPEKPTTERLLKIQEVDEYGLQGLDVRESYLLKSKSSDWLTALRNPQKEFNEDGFNAKDTRTTIYKRLLGDGFLLIEKIIQYWDGSNWVNDYKWTYTYDVSNNLIEELGQEWDGSNWVNIDKWTYTYDVNNNLIEYLWQIWDVSNWRNVRKESYSYTPTEVEEFEGEVNTYSLSNNYPNPFNPSTTITYSVPERSKVSLKVFDLLGSEVAELVKGEIEAGTYDINFNASTLPTGVYFYQLQAGSFVETKKMVLIK